MNNLQIALLLFISLILSGCQKSDTLSNEHSSVKRTAKALTLNSIAVQNEQINAAIHLLDAGKEKKAEKLIREVLSYNKKHKTAKLLLNQLTQPTTNIFKTKRTVDYTVKDGDSLSKIAEDYLGNSLYFISLVKLNKLSKASDLKPKTIIKIPVPTDGKIAKKEKTRSAANLKLLEQYRSDKNYLTGLKKSNSLFFVKKDQQELFKQQELLLESLAASSISLSDREKMLKQVSQLSKQTTSKKQINLYQKFLTKQSQQLLLDESILLYRDKSYIEAGQKLINAKKINPIIDKEATGFTIEKNIINKLHEQAVSLYGKKAFKEALLRWQVILKIEPKNELAQKYTERTKKLLNKLNQY